LPAPESGAFAVRAYEAPQGTLEAALAAVWQEVLGVARVGRHDDFFALGGHSLLAVRVSERMQRCGWTLPVRALFETPELAALSQNLAASAAREFVAPPNLIPFESDTITPEMLTLFHKNETK
jgi:hypothetical protein